MPMIPILDYIINNNWSIFIYWLKKIIWTYDCTKGYWLCNFG